MDALEILADLENIFPYFYPIFSADEQRIMGYEVLGKYQSDREIISLQPFFHDEEIPVEYKSDVDLILVRKALEKILQNDEEIYILLNRNVELLMYENGEPFLQELLDFEKRGLNLKKVVLEISGSVDWDIDHFDHLLQYYRTYGIKIAISGLNEVSHNFERLGRLEPNILKINLEPLKSSATGTNFNDVLFTLSLFSRKIGATLMFENIEMSYQLQFAWRNGGRYYQGSYLYPPSTEFLPNDMIKDRLKEKFHDFIAYEKRKLEAVFTAQENFQLKVQEIVMKNKKANYEELLQALGKDTIKQYA